VQHRLERAPWLANGLCLGGDPSGGLGGFDASSIGGRDARELGGELGCLTLRLFLDRAVRLGGRLCGCRLRGGVPG
jgi:hypothetical protein